MKLLSHRRQTGMTLIEVLVAILIFSVGLLGFVGLYMRAIEFSGAAEDSNRAALLANEIASQMQLARTVNLPAASVTAWKARVADASGLGLPGGIGDVQASAAATNMATVTVSWTAIKTAGAPAHTFITQVIVP